MTVTREEILKEVKRTAEANNGKPPGRLTFLAQTGIRKHDWRGRFWARWNDVLQEAGYGPNTKTEARDDEVLLERFAELSLELGRVATFTEMRLKKRTDPTFPNDKTYSRFGSKEQLEHRLLEHCQTHPKYAELIPLIQIKSTDEPAPVDSTSTEVADGFVYLVKMGRHYKIGKTFSIPRRHRELALELPEKLTPIHTIRTDDPSGIEAYWHKRFQAKRTNSEWFALSPAEVSIFKKRRFM